MKEADLFIKMLNDFSGVDVSLVLAFISGLQAGRKISVPPVALPETPSVAPLPVEPVAEPSVAPYRFVLNVPEIKDYKG